MSKNFPPILERRYAKCPRRYLNEYFWGRRAWNDPSTKGPCATLVSAKKHADAAIRIWGYSAVRIFDRLTGRYVSTFKGQRIGKANAILEFPGMVK